MVVCTYLLFVYWQTRDDPGVVCHCCTSSTAIDTCGWWCSAKGVQWEHTDQDAVGMTVLDCVLRVELKHTRTPLAQKLAAP